MPFTLGEASMQSRECDCPPQVTHCRHFDGKVLGLTAPAANELPELIRHLEMCNPAPFFDFEVGTTSGFAPCKCGAMFATRPGISHYRGDSEADALEAFYKAEERLLRGELA